MSHGSISLKNGIVVLTFFIILIQILNYVASMDIFYVLYYILQVGTRKITEIAQVGTCETRLVFTQGSVRSTIKKIKTTLVFNYLKLESWRSIIKIKKLEIYTDF